MWIEALWFFAKNENAPMECIEELLKNIDELDILPPLMVLEILSHSHSVTLGVVKGKYCLYQEYMNKFVTPQQECDTFYGYRLVMAHLVLFCNLSHFLSRINIHTFSLV